MNKLWNASRFALMNLGDAPARHVDVSDLRLQDRWILSRVQDVAEQETAQIDAYDVGSAARMLYDFVWGDLCDWYLEMAKPALKGDEGEDRKRAAQAVLDEVFKSVLPLLHPFIPFVTEELWEAFGYSEKIPSIMNAPWPTLKQEYRFDVYDDMKDLQEAVRILRNLRAEAHVAPQQWVNGAVVRVDKAETVATLKGALPIISMLCRVKRIDILPTATPRPGESLSSVFASGEISLSVGDILDIAAEAERLKQELVAIEKTVASSRARLEKPDFVSRAPQEVVDKEKGRVDEGLSQIERLRENLESLGV
jgi:valyl-tRNA synthetase